MFGKTIKLYLADGSPTGLRHVEIANWTGQAIACPRSRFSELGGWEETKRPGIYLLLARGEDRGDSRAYIGESENVYVRLASHEREKDFWNEVVCFTSKDENLTKAHVKYLESRIIQHAYDANRYKLENSNSPNIPGLPRSDKDAMEEFIVSIRMVLGTLGYRLLEKLVPASSDDQGNEDNKVGVGSISGRRLLFSFKGLKAEGMQTDEGFLVFAGSQISRDAQPSCPAVVAGIRDRMIAENILSESDSHYELAKEFLFNSSSQAACFVSGSSRNGRETWKDAKGKTLKELEASIATEMLN